MRWYGVFILGLVVLAAGASPAAAQHARDHVRAGRVQPLDSILPGIRHSRPGTFYDAEGPFEAPDGRYHYRLKWMTPSGRIIWLDTDAHTGRVLGVDRGQRRPVWDRGGPYFQERNYDGPRRYERGRPYEEGRPVYRGRAYPNRDYRQRDNRRRDNYRDNSRYRQERRNPPRHYDRERSRGGPGEYRGRRDSHYNNRGGGNRGDRRGGGGRDRDRW